MRSDRRFRKWTQRVEDLPDGRYAVFQHFNIDQYQRASGHPTTADDRELVQLAKRLVRMSDAQFTAEYGGLLERLTAEQDARVTIWEMTVEDVYERTPGGELCVAFVHEETGWRHSWWIFDVLVDADEDTIRVDGLNRILARDWRDLTWEAFSRKYGGLPLEVESGGPPVLDLSRLDEWIDEHLD